MLHCASIHCHDSGFFNDIIHWLHTFELCYILLLSTDGIVFKSLYNIHFSGRDDYHIHVITHNHHDKNNQSCVQKEACFCTRRHTNISVWCNDDGTREKLSTGSYFGSWSMACNSHSSCNAMPRIGCSCVSGDTYMHYIWYLFQIIQALHGYT